jgi:hypothetical protein
LFRQKPGESLVRLFLKIHRVENQRCWWKAHIRKGLVCTVPPATFLIASTNIQFSTNEEFEANLDAA